MRTADLVGVLLDYWVARAEGIDLDGYLGEFTPSADWAQGGPIIERKQVFLFQHWRDPEPWSAWIGADWAGGYELSGADHKGSGPTPLVAAMRAYVASKFGDTVPDNEIAT